MYKADETERINADFGKLIKYYANKCAEREAKEEMENELWSFLYGIIKNNRAVSKRYTAVAIRNRFLSRLQEAEKTHACKAELKNICAGYEDDGYVEKIEMRDLLDRLGGKQRNAVILHHVYGLSFNEIAKKHGCARQAASALGSRGIKKLKKMLTDKTEL